MKSLILLLLILPSLCFGRSVRIMIVTQKGEGTQKVSITDSKTKTREVFLLKLHKDSIVVGDNLKELSTLLNSLKSTLGDIPNIIQGGKSFPSVATEFEITQTAVFENWQITFKKETVTANMVVDEIFLYKDDQFTPKPYK